MKTFRNKLFLFPGIALLFAFALTESSDALLAEISNAIRQGRTADVAKHFGANVDLALPGSEGTFSKAQVEVMLRNFFADNTPESISTVHKGSSRDGSFFAILSLQTQAGDNFRVYILLKRVSDSFLLHQLKFETQ